MLTKCLLLLFLPFVLGFQKKIHIAGLFDSDEVIQNAFELSIKRVNKQRHQSEELSNTILSPEINAIDANVFETSQKVCDLLSIGVAGIFGPQDKVTAEHVQSMCDTMEMPHIAARWDPEQARGKAVNLYPHAETLAMAFYHIVNEYEWKSFAAVFENTDSLSRIHPVLDQWKDVRHNIALYHLGSGPNYRQIFQQIKESPVENVIIDCSDEILHEVLKQAHQVGIISDRYRIIVTSLNLQTFDLEPYQYSGVNLTGVRLIDIDDSTVQEIFEYHGTEWGLESPSQLRVEAALMYDAVQLFARAFKQLKDAIKGDVKPLYCNRSENWEHGISLSNFMRLSEMKGLTGIIKFDTAGFRSNFQLDIVRLYNTGLKKVGEWNSTNSIKWLSDSPPWSTNKALSLRNTTFTVLISLTPPYGMLKESAAMMVGNERYEGFAIDIIIELSKMLGFNYTFVEQKDNVYGSLSKKTKQWNGMLRRIIDGEADLAITDLTITAEREGAVDFTTPFMNLGISILYKKPRKAAPSLFSFLSPFSNDVWVHLIIAYIVVSILFFCIGRISPAEWNNPYPCIEEPESLENQFTFKNSFWFTIGAIMQQGSELAPISVSTRTLAGAWWFFCLIMVSSYTANLAAALTVEAKTLPFTDVEELAESGIKYGAKISGSTIDFFKNYATSKEATQPVYKKIFNYMQANAKDVLMASNDLGVEKVLNEDYAFFMESTSIEYIKERKCDVDEVGSHLDEKGYGIAMKKGSTHRHELNSAVLKLQESGKITQLKDTWWSRKRGGGTCNEAGGASSTEPLGLQHVGGVFLVLSVGVALSSVYTITEMLWDIFRKSIIDNMSFKEELVDELKFIVKFNGQTKPIKQRKESSFSRSIEESTDGESPPYTLVPTVITSPPENK